MASYNVVKYATVNSTLNPGEEKLNIIEPYIIDHYKVIEWVIFNDSVTTEILLQIEAEEGSIVIKAGEYFGDKRATTKILLSNLGLDPVPFRCVVKLI